MTGLILLLLHLGGPGPQPETLLPPDILDRGTLTDPRLSNNEPWAPRPDLTIASVRIPLSVPPPPAAECEAVLVDCQHNAFGCEETIEWRGWPINLEEAKPFRRVQLGLRSDGVVVWREVGDGRGK
jgi:hypothetical protein